MASMISSHLRSNVVGYLALFLALSGGAYAMTAPRNSVVSTSIKNGQVKSVDLGTSAVGGSDLATGSVGSAEIRIGAVGTSELADGSVGSADIGNGAVTPAKLADNTLSLTPRVTVRSLYANPLTDTILECASGEVALGGGVGADLVGTQYVARSQPYPGSGTPTGWYASVRNRLDGSEGSGTVYVVCEH
jgi:hypothetical protein